MLTKQLITEHIGTWDDLLALWWIIPLDCLILLLLYKGLWWWCEGSC